MNWRAISKEAFLVTLAGCGPALAFLQQNHPTWTWAGMIASLTAYLLARLQASPVQAKVIEAQKKELDSLRPPAPRERNI